MALTLVAAFGMKDAVPPWTVALCLLGAISAAVAGRRMARIRPALIAFGIGAGAMALLGLAESSVWATGPLVLTLAAGMPWLAGRYLRQQDELGQARAETARLRIAETMHDSLGHDLSLLAVRAGALQLAPGLTDDQRASAAELRAGAAAAIERLAEVIVMMREGAAPLEPVPHRVEDVVERAATAGMEVALVREALTNAAKHAPGAAVTVRVAADAEETVVTVTNGPGARTGLSALEEQIVRAGGTFEAGPRDGGFAVTARLPRREAQ